MLRFIVSAILIFTASSVAGSQATSGTTSATASATKSAKKAAAVGKVFTGAWKANDGTMLITFFGSDSIKVSDSKGQKKTESVGTYTKTDTTFTATLNNNDIILKMTFKYVVKDKKTVSAMVTNFTVDGEKTDAPKKWMNMSRIINKK